MSLTLDGSSGIGFPGGGTLVGVGGVTPMRLIGTADVVGGELNISGLDVSGFRNLIVMFRNVVSSTDTGYLKLQLKNNAGNITTTIYRHAYFLASSGGTTRVEGGSTALDHLPIVGSLTSTWSWGSAATDYCYGQITIACAGISTPKMVTSDSGFGFGNGSASFGLSKVAGTVDITDIITGVRLFGAAALVSGSMEIYGVA